MLARLRDNGWLKGAIGVATAFVLAVQMLLAVVAATQMAVAGPLDASAICYGDHASDASSSSPATQPIDHAACAICVLASFAAPLPDRIEPAHSIAAVAGTIPHAAGQSLPAPGRRHDPRTSQGPPQNV